MIAYTWPGNVRELAAVIERAAILGEGRRLDVARALGSSSLPAPDQARPAPAFAGPHYAAPGAAATHAPHAAAPPAASGYPASSSIPPALEDPATIEPLEVAIRRHIERALAACHGRVDGRYGAARLLEINPQTLRARMRKLGIDWASYRSAGDPDELD